MDSAQKCCVENKPSQLCPKAVPRLSQAVPRLCPKAKNRRRVFFHNGICEDSSGTGTGSWDSIWWDLETGSHWDHAVICQGWIASPPHFPSDSMEARYRAAIQTLEPHPTPHLTEQTRWSSTCCMYMTCVHSRGQGLTGPASGRVRRREYRV